MLLIQTPSTDPAFNLALEEYLLTSLRQESIMLWRNRTSVIIGRNQNAIEEIDLDFIRANSIPVVRRQSGGGAVFHDLGNINFTVILPMQEGDFSNYQKFTTPILEFLQSLGVAATLQGRNDLVVDGMKISGNAQVVKNGWILHHGTLLFDADFEHLAGALCPNTAKIESKGIKSVRSRVTNIASHLPAPMKVELFLEQLSSYFYTHIPALTSYTLSAEELAAVTHLVAEKYGSWAWNFGNSPAYNYEKSLQFPFGFVALRLTVSGGIIQAAYLLGDFFGLRDKAELENLLIGLPVQQELIAAALESVCISDYISEITRAQFLSLIE